MILLSLRPFTHQEVAIKNLDKQFKNKRKALVVLPSGSGKTHTIAFHVARLKPKTFLYIVHRNEILYQSIKIFKEICGWDDSQIGVLNTDFKQFDRPYIFATVQTLGFTRNLQKLSHDIDYVVVDEYHHSAAETYQKVLHYFRNVKKFVGLTATPYRLDQKDIMSYVNNNLAHNIDLFDGIEQKILVPFHYIGLYDDIDYTKIKFSGYSYKITDLDRKLIIHKRDEAVIAEYKDKIMPGNRLTIAFCNSIAHLNRITSKFRAAGINAASVTYHEKYDRRREVIEQFKKGYYKVLFTRDILNEGVDFPECSAIMFLRPTVSKTLFFQQLGRGLRTHPGKEDVLVLDFIGNYVRAFEKTKWFFNINLKRFTGRYFKPFYEYNVPKPVVEFEGKVIKMMELQEYGITKNDILEDYLNCCEKEGKKMLTSTEYERSDYSKYSLNMLLHRFGKFSGFITENHLDYPNSFERKFPIGFFKCKDKKLLTENYFNIKKETNKIPLLRQINDPQYSKYSQYCYRCVWGRFSDFLKDIGEIKENEYSRNDPYEIKEEKIKNAIKSLQKQMGTEYISASDWHLNYGPNFGRDFINKFGGFAKFRKHFDIPDFFIKKCGYCGKDMECRTMRLKNCCSQHCNNRFFYEKLIKPKKVKEAEKRALRTIDCLQCGKTVPEYAGSNKRRFCSKYCIQRYKISKGREKLEFIKCLYCDTKIKGPFFVDSKTNPKYCSPKCRGNYYYRRGHPPKIKIIKVCKNCNSNKTLIDSSNGRKPLAKWYHLPWDKENFYCAKCYYKLKRSVKNVPDL